MMLRYLSRLVWVLLVVLVIASVINAFAANIPLPSTRLTKQTQAITANTLKPAACSAISLTAIIYCPTGGGGACDGTPGNDLILGTSSIDSIQGKGGSDCILGAGGNDDISGSQANDVCIGGPGTDTFKKCETMIQ
jgi:hypothetical protein